MGGGGKGGGGGVGTGCQSLCCEAHLPMTLLRYETRNAEEMGHRKGRRGLEGGFWIALDSTG